MATIHPIASFRPDVDRDYFGAWLSGFVDGEGCFQLHREKTGIGSCRLLIKLRCDDLSILRDIQAYFGVGVVSVRDPTEYALKSHPGTNPQAHYAVARIGDHIRVVIPHFVRFPLMAKKREAFEIWRQGVEMVHRIGKRPRISGYRTGSRPKWTSREISDFEVLRSALKDQHRFDPSGIHFASTDTRPVDPGLIQGDLFT